MFFFIDTVSPNPKIIIKNNNIINFIKIPINNDIKISESLIVQMIDMFKNNFDIKKVKKICVCTGPGSFTSLRMGIAAAIGLKLALNLPFYGLTAFEILLQYSRKKFSYKNICVFIQSSNDQKFYSIFDKNNNFIMKPTKIYNIENIRNIAKDSMLISNYNINTDNKNLNKEFSKILVKDIGEIMSSYSFINFKSKKDFLFPYYIS